MAMERYRREMEAIETERINFLNKIDLVQPSFEEQHQLEVRQRSHRVRVRSYSTAAAAARYVHARTIDNTRWQHDHQA